MSENIKQQESSTSQNYTKTTDNSNYSETFNKGDIEKIENTVFGIANNHRGWFLTMGSKIISEPKETRKECIEQLEKDMWNIIMKMIIVVTDHTIEVALDERAKKD